MLSKPAMNALQDCYDNPLMVVSDLASVLAREMLRLYPPGWNDPVTPERLVGLGGELAQMSEVITFESCAEFWFSACDVRQCHVYDKYRTTWVRIPCYMIPRNMKEARELLVRCGAIKGEK